MSGPLEFEVFTIFPGAIEAFVATGLLGKAIARDLVAVHCTDLRDFSHDRHRIVDDAPFGGGAGMVIKPEPVAAAIESVVEARGPMHTILLTPSGAPFDQRVAERLARERRIALLCGRYEGIDDRIREGWVDECLSIGDFVLNGGEVAAAAIIEAVGRLREGVLGNPDSIAHESFARDPWDAGLVLEHPHYTRPAEFRGRRVPPVLLGGDHQAIEAWRRRAACLRTWSLRPELRPRWRLPAGHPIHLGFDLGGGAADESLDAEARREIAALAAEHPVTVHVVGRGERMRDLKQLRKHLRRKEGAEPWVIGVGRAAPGEPVRGPRMILDVLAHERASPPGPLLLWFGPQPAKAAPEAYLALEPEPEEVVSSGPEARLAIDLALIDISQPQSARGPIASLARAALRAMRDQGLLPAEPGGASAPQDRETSP